MLALAVLLVIGANDALATNAAPAENATPETTASGAPVSPDAASESSGESVVRARRGRGIAAVAVKAAEARAVPGAEGDAPKVVHDLPGVARAPFSSGQLVVWGADPADTRVEIDGVEVPSLFHFGGLRSVISSELVDDVALVPGAYGVDHGRGIGGIVEVTTKELPDDGVHGVASADVIDGAALVSASIPQARVAIAGRVSWLDLLLARTDVGDFFPIPHYFDAQSKATIPLRDGEQVSVGILASGDSLDRTVPAEDPAEVRSQTVDTSFYRLYARYTRLLDDGARLTVTPWVGYDVDDEATATGAVKTSAEASSVDAGLRAAYRKRIVHGVTLNLGVDALDSASDLARSGTLGIPAREGDDVAFGQPPSDEINADRWSASTVDVAPFASTELRAGGVTVTPGVRVDGYALGASRITPRFAGNPPVGVLTTAFVVDPRVLAEWRATDDVAVRAGAGIYHQPRAPTDTSAVFGTPNLGLERSTHYALAVSTRLTSALDLETTVYRRVSESLVVRSDEAPLELARTLTQDGTGDDVGASVLLRQRLMHGVFGWLAYTLSRSERQDGAAGRPRLSDFDQTHTLSLVGSYDVGGFTVGARARAATGYPRTPVAGAYYDAKDDRYQPLFGPKDSARLPAFFQLDARAAYAFTISPLAISVYAELLNVTLAKNPEEIAYDFDYAQQAFITGLPFLAVVGARVEL